MLDKSIISSAPAFPLRSSAWVGPPLSSNARLKPKRGAISRRLQVYAVTLPQHDKKKTYWEKSSTQAVELLLSDQPLDEDDRVAIAETLKLLNWISSAGQRSASVYPPCISDGATTSPSNAVAGPAGNVVFENDATDLGEVDNNLVKKLEVSPGYSNTLLLQGFNWDSCRHTGGWYNHVLKHTAEIAGAGFTHIYLPPPSQSVSAEGYLPNQLYQLNSKYGTKEELKKLVRALRKVGVKAVADIVINHRCADKQNKNGEWVIYTDEVEHKGHSLSWGEWAIVSDDPIFHGTGNSGQGEIYSAAPDLDHSNKDVRLALTDWINYLKTDIGFAGWRFDFAKGYPPIYTEEYVVKSVGKESFCVGEIWTSCGYGPSGLNTQQDQHRQGLVDWVDATKGSSAAFDFTTKAVLQEAVKDQLWRLRDASGRPAGMLGWWPNRAVTFLDNHDTGGTQNHWPFPTEHISQGYAYILTHPGIPCVFWDHLFKYGKDITPLMEARKKAEVKAESRVVIQAAEGDFYLAEITGDAGSLLVKLGSRLNMGSLAPGKAYKLYTSGKNYAVWIALRSDNASIAIKSGKASQN